MPVAFQEPLAVVAVLEGVQGLAGFLRGLEGPNPEELFVPRADEALSAALALGRPDERGARLHAEEAELGLEDVPQLLAPMIVADRQTGGAGLGVAAEQRAHPLAERFQRFEAGPAARGVDPHALGGVVIDGHEDGGGALRV